MPLSPLYVLTPVFNPRRWNSRTKLYGNFAAWCARSNVQLLTIEVAFGRRDFAITDAANRWHLQLRTNNELWHKERALNLGLQRLHQLAPGWEYVAWMDSDVKLARDDWPTEAAHLLQHYAVVQMFGEATMLGPQHEHNYTAQGILKNYRTYGTIEWGDTPGLRSHRGCYSPRRGHPGLAWAFRRWELDQVGGWFDTCVNGSGDLYMAGCYTGKPTLAIPDVATPGYRAAILRYGERCEAKVRRNVSFMPGLALHYWHGKAATRGYDSRWQILTRHRFDPVTDLTVDSQGLYRWAGNKPQLEYEMRESLAERNEDSIDP